MDKKKNRTSELQENLFIVLARPVSIIELMERCNTIACNCVATERSAKMGSVIFRTAVWYIYTLSRANVCCVLCEV